MVEDFTVGDHVTVDWLGGHCNHCPPYRKDICICYANIKIPSWHEPDGYAESVTVPANALARIPTKRSFVEATPMGYSGLHHLLRAAQDQSIDRLAGL